MSPRILVCGEALVDLVPVRSDGGASGRSVNPSPSGRSAGSAPGNLFAAELGGGPFNVAVTLGRLGCSVGFVSRISTDPFGHRIIVRLIESGVDVSAVQRGNEPTTLALTALDERGAAGYTFYAEGTADRLVSDPGVLPESVAAVSFGTLSLLYEPGAGMYARLLARAHAERRMTMLDPNIRPPAIEDPDDYRRRFTSWLESVHILKVSEDDADWLGTGVAGSGIAHWLDAGVAAVVLTRGGDGMSVITPKFRRDIAAPPVTVVDTIGAGDTAHGALLAWLDRDGALDPVAIREYGPEDWAAAIKFAANAAAITVSRRGADPPWARELHND